MQPQEIPAYPESNGSLIQQMFYSIGMDDKGLFAQIKLNLEHRVFYVSTIERIAEEAKSSKNQIIFG